MKSKGTKEKDRQTKGRGPVEGERNMQITQLRATGTHECQKASASTKGAATNAHGQSHYSQGNLPTCQMPARSNSQNPQRAAFKTRRSPTHLPGNTQSYGSSRTLMDAA